MEYRGPGKTTLLSQWADYAAAVATAPNKAQITASTQNQLEKSFSSATAIAHRYPQYASAITAGAKTSFLHGADWAYAVGAIATAIGIVLVLFLFPTRTTSSGCSANTTKRTPGSSGQAQVLPVEAHILQRIPALGDPGLRGGGRLLQPDLLAGGLRGGEP